MNINLLIKTSVFAISLASLSAVAVENLTNAQLSSLEVRKNINSTLKRSNDTWVTYQVEMEANNGMPCCYQGKDSLGCRLDKRVNSWGSHRKDESDSKVLDIYFKWQNQQASELFYAGSECPVNAAGQKVVSIKDVSQKQSIQFLEQYLSPYGKAENKRISSKALAGIALHRGDYAQKKLEEFSSSDNSRLSKNAIFWLGEARNKAGYDVLVDILDDSGRSSKIKEKAVFALTQSDYPKAMDKVVELAKDNDNERVQEKAVFWLGQTEHPQAAEIIESIFTSNASHRVKEKAVFALSELNTDSSWKRLVKLAQSDEYPGIREKAIFWVSQNNKRDAHRVLMDIIDGPNPESVKVKAVFGLSQLSNELATSSLIQVMKTAESKRVRKKALFWLGQSDDPKALEAIESVLTAAIN